MKLRIKHTGLIVDGKLTMTDRERSLLKDKLKYFEGKRVSIIIEEELTNPSTEQRGYYYGVLLPIWKKLLVNQDKDNMLLNTEVLHKMAMKMFLPPVEILLNRQTGEVVEVEPSTKNGNCSKEMYSVLIEGMIRFIAEEYGEIVPEPNEQLKLFKKYIK